MQIEPFALERYFARYEFDVPHLLSPSDSEPYTLPEVLAYATPEQHDAWDNLWLGYTESAGSAALRAGVAALYDGTIGPQQVIGVVPEEGIFIAMNTLLAAGDHVIVTAPGYQSLYSIAAALGCVVDAWGPNPDGWFFDVDELESLLTPATRLIVVNFPHNPTGALPSQDEFRAICDLAAERGIVVFSDEMYRWFEYDEADRLPSAAEIYPDAVALSGLSKSFGMPGLRVGWLATQNADFMAQFQGFKDYTTICGSAPSEMLAVIALDNAEALAARNLSITLENLATARAFIAERPRLLAWQPPRAGTMALVQVVPDVNIDAFADEAVTNHGVMVLPSSVYGYPGRYFRLGFGRRSMPEALAAFGQFVDARFR
jgi:aspartate/methionine/tyrosine aminotransferase